MRTSRDSHVLRIAPGREKSLRRRHPWIFSGSILDEPDHALPGETVDVVAAGGQWLARAAWSPDSQIRARVWTFDEADTVDEEWIARRVRRAVAARRGALACRLVHGESDGLPGVIADRYGDVVVCQFLGVGGEYWHDAIAAALVDATGATSLYERSDADARTKEGLPLRCGLLRGREPAPLVEIDEDGRRYLVDVREGHKTGFYLDQRGGREALRRWSEGRDVLNAFSYTGGFTVAALAGGATRVTDIDTSAPALELSRRNVALNGLDDGRHETIDGDVFAVLRRFRDSRRSFDAIVLDPPKFADARAHLDRAARGYKDINLLAFKLLAEGGVLMTFSCSGLVAPELFQKIVADAALDAGREAVIVERLAQGADHPVALPFPEGAYLKGLVCRVQD